MTGSGLTYTTMRFFLSQPAAFGPERYHNGPSRSAELPSVGAPEQYVRPRIKSGRDNVAGRSRMKGNFEPLLPPTRRALGESAVLLAQPYASRRKPLE